MRILESFPVRLAIVFLVLVALSGASTVLVTMRIFDRRQVEIDQRLNRGVARSMASELEPIVNAHGEQVGSVMHYMMVMNPAVEIYLLARDGTILDYFAEPGPPVQMDRVDTGPVERFVTGDPLPILGDNPRHPGERHHFSAATIELPGSEAGYLYVILRSSEYDTATMDLRDRYLFQALLTAFLATLFVVGILGVVVFRVTTLPLQRLTATVRAFGAGDHGARAGIQSRDEIGDLSRNFDEMADTIVADVERLEAADRERRNLIANISHDLRNPLATIQGYLETLFEKDAELNPAERTRYYGILLDTTRSLPRLVDDLFELSRLDQPDVAPAMEPFSLAELVQDVAIQWRRRAEDKGIRLHVEEPAGLALVCGNVGMVERVITNLLRNALTHTAHGGRITVTVGADNETAAVSVTDTGCGIAPDDLERVFDRFFIGDDSRSRSGDGSGLGLAICKRIVELHDGSISVMSTVGEGSTFQFTLPIAT
jgi:signal transduction histidine kinase